MRCTYTFQIESLGTVEVLEKINARGMSIRVYEGGVVRVTVLPHTPQQEIARYIVEQREWIDKARRRVLARGHQPTIFTPQTAFRTTQHTLRLTPDSPNGRVYLDVSRGEIRVRYPAGINPAENEVVQSLARKGIAFAYKVEGQKVLPQRVAQLAAQHGFTFASVTLRDLKSRWGACSAKKEIQLNVQLMRLPQHLIDHVILHELCHTVEMNHGPKFHALLNKVDNGLAVQHDKELNAYRTQIY